MPVHKMWYVPGVQRDDGLVSLEAPEPLCPSRGDDAECEVWIPFGPQCQGAGLFLLLRRVCGRAGLRRPGSRIGPSGPTA